MVDEHLRAVEELGDAAGRQHHRHRQPEHVHIPLELAVDAVHVVVVGEHQQVVGIGVQEIRHQRPVEDHDAGVPGLGLGEACPQRDLQGEVHQAHEVGLVAVVARLAALPVGDDAGIVVPLLADDVEVGVLGHDPPGPVGQEVLVGVGPRVYADSGQVGVLDPPDRVLDQVVRQVGIPLVEIGHARHEPTVDEGAAVDLGGVGIVQGFADVVGRHEAAVVDPVAGGQIVHPPVADAAVVGNQIHDDADAALPRLGGKFAVQVVVAEPGIDAVVVGR